MPYRLQWYDIWTLWFRILNAVELTSVDILLILCLGRKTLTRPYPTKVDSVIYLYHFELGLRVIPATSYASWTLWCWVFLIYCCGLDHCWSVWVEKHQLDPTHKGGLLYLFVSIASSWVCMPSWQLNAILLLWLWPLLSFLVGIKYINLSLS